MKVTIRAATSADADTLAEIVCRSFADVARRFALTPENCPKHPSNCTVRWIEEEQKRGVRYFIAELDGEPSACVAMEAASDGMHYLERLAVLPHRRRCGIGRLLVEHVIGTAKTAGANGVSLCIIAKHSELHEWYRRLGFQETTTKRFAHLPFDVLFMERKFAEPADN